MTSDILDMSRVFLTKLTQAVLQVCASLCRVLNQIVSFDDFVLYSGKLSTNWVSKESVEVPVGLHYLSLMPMVETTRKHSFCECNKIRRRGQIPQLVHPEFAAIAHSSLYFVNDQVDTHLRRQVAQTLSKLSREHVVAAFSLHRLDDDCNDFAALLRFPLINFGSDVGQGILILLPVVFDIVFERILVDWVLGCRPVKGRNVGLLYSLRA